MFPGITDGGIEAHL